MDINDLVTRIEKLEKRMDALDDVPRIEKGERKELSIKEFLIDKKPSGDVQKTLVIGYYLEHHRKEDCFNVKDLTDGFRNAKEPLPTNMNDKVNLNISKGHMMAAREEKDNYKAWILTNTGERFVEEGLKLEGK